MARRFVTWCGNTFPAIATGSSRIPRCRWMRRAWMRRGSRGSRPTVRQLRNWSRRCRELPVGRMSPSNISSRSTRCWMSATSAGSTACNNWSAAPVSWCLTRPEPARHCSGRPTTWLPFDAGSTSCYGSAPTTVPRNWSTRWREWWAWRGSTSTAWASTSTTSRATTASRASCTR